MLGSRKRPFLLHAISPFFKEEVFQLQPKRSYLTYLLLSYSLNFTVTCITKWELDICYNWWLIIDSFLNLKFLSLFIEDFFYMITGQLHSPSGDSDNSNGSQRAVVVPRAEVEQQHRQRHQRQASVPDSIPALTSTNHSSAITTTTAFTVASSMLLLQTQVSLIFNQQQ